MNTPVDIDKRQIGKLAGRIFLGVAQFALSAHTAHPETTAELHGSLDS